MANSSALRTSLVALTTTALFSVAGTAEAVVISGASSAAAIQSTATFGGFSIPGLMFSAEGNSPPGYTDSQTLNSVALTLTPPGGVGRTSSSSGVAELVAESDVDGAPGSRSASASTNMASAGLDIDLALTSTVLGATDFLTFSADAILVDALASGDHGALNSSGNLVFAQAAADLLGINLLAAAMADGFVEVDLNALTSGLVLGNLRFDIGVVENTGDGISSVGTTRTAFRFDFDNVNVVATGAVLDGRLDFASASASLTAMPDPLGVPEPAGLALFGLGLLGLGLRSARDSTS